MMQKSLFIIIIAVLSGVNLLLGCSEPRRDFLEAPPPKLSTVMDMHGEWVDLNNAIVFAAADAGLAVLSSDRWNTMVKYELVTDNGQPGSLVVIGNRGDTAEVDTKSTSGGGHLQKPGVYRAEARIGRLRDAQRERLLLEALKSHLQKMAEQQSG